MIFKNKWKKISVIVLLMLAVSYPAAYYFVLRSDAYATTKDFLNKNEDVQKNVGKIEKISLDFTGYSIRISGAHGTANFSVRVHGSGGAPRAYIELERRGVWDVKFARLMPDQGPAIVLKQ